MSTEMTAADLIARLATVEAERDSWRASAMSMYADAGVAWGGLAVLRGRIESLADRYDDMPFNAHGAELRSLLDDIDSDPEQFCPRCLAGTESSEHFEKCGGA